jgi:hypothetical protein
MFTNCKLRLGSKSLKQGNIQGVSGVYLMTNNLIHLIYEFKMQALYSLFIQYTLVEQV